MESAKTESRAVLYRDRVPQRRDDLGGPGPRGPSYDGEAPPAGVAVRAGGPGASSGGSTTTGPLNSAVGATTRTAGPAARPPAGGTSVQCAADLRALSAKPHDSSRVHSGRALSTDAISDLTEIELDLKKQLTALSNKVNSHGFTPRGQKPDARSKAHRLAAEPLPPTGSWPQGLSKKVAFDKSKAEFVSVCQHSLCKQTRSKHWHRDCPAHGGPRAENSSVHSFTTGDLSDLLAASFQDAFEEQTNAKFNALCIIANGRPELCDEISAASFSENNEIDFLSEYTAFAQPAAAEDSDEDEPAVPIPFNSCEWEGTGELQPQFDFDKTGTFADIVQADQGPHALQFDNFNFGVDNDNSGILPADSDSDSDVDVSHEFTLDEPVVPPPPQIFGGALPIRFQRMTLPLLLAAVFCVCATAAPATACGVGGVPQTDFDLIIPPVGGAERVPDVRPDPPPLT
ncbi:hypothetical protein CYMTET_5674 [Cymbomonas tetramitiformis]|uniref:Uncharacterized protein n=1 Tax=Cymbomonas tetramitiformis TaxID=36881 RepID=A0AAE0H0L9_9CHLO|nr:hypothetical protein CYMTET_5674 [Cymbomonas tetramitiformis]